MYEKQHYPAQIKNVVGLTASGDSNSSQTQTQKTPSPSRKIIVRRITRRFAIEFHSC